jgi:hypothetical protein
MKRARPLIPRLPLLAATLFSLSAVPAGAASPNDGWVQDANEKGVVVTTRTEAGRSLPVFRGVSTLDARLFEILAVLDDVAHHTEWMADCKTARIVKQINELERIEYNRISAPWPILDRDTTIRTWVEATPANGEVWARFSSISVPEAPPVSGIVRMPRLAGFYHLEWIDDTHTKVTYQVDADPGGLLPDWLVKLTSRKLPIETLVGLREQVHKTRGKYEAFLQKYDPKKGGKVPAALDK